jgi:hypothetical protein
MPRSWPGTATARREPCCARRPCHPRAIPSGPDRSRVDNHGQPRSSLDLRRSPSPQVTILADLALQARGRLVEACISIPLLLPPGRPSSCAQFEDVRRWGTTTPLTRDSPSIQGDVPGPDPARAPPSKAVAGGARLSGAAGGGLPCQARSATRSATAPASGACLVHVWATCHRSPAVPNGLQRSPAARRSRRPPVQSWGNKPVGRTLIRMRAEVQVLPGPLPATTSGNARHTLFGAGAAPYGG